MGPVAEPVEDAPGSAGGGPLSSDGNSVGTSPTSVGVTVSIVGVVGHVTSKSIGGISRPAMLELSAVMNAFALVIAELA